MRPNRYLAFYNSVPGPRTRYFAAPSPISVTSIRFMLPLW